MADILHPYGDLDVLGYYSKASAKLTKFLKGRELSGKVHFPGARRPLLTRGSQLPPLSAEELAENVDDDFLRVRSGHHLEDVKGRITLIQQKIWRYFPPRKLADLFYATNGERGARIDRVFIDIDRGEGTTAEEAQAVAKHLIDIIRDDKDFSSLVKFDFYVQYTGSSFHVYLMLKKPATAGFYSEHLAYTKSNPLGSFTGRWAESIRKETGLKVYGGHEKLPGALVIDSSQTPPGKLARAPFSLHMADAKTVDGIAIPIRPEALSDKDLLKWAMAYTPEKTIADLDMLSRALP